MSIVSVEFFAFVIGVVALYFIVPKRFQWWVLVLANTLFYIYGGWEMIFYLLGSVAVAFFTSRIMNKYFVLQDKESEGLDRKEKKPIKLKYNKKRRSVLIIGIVLVLAGLAITKYTGFMLQNLNSIFGLCGISKINVENITSYLPSILGCSYFTLSIIGYMTDVYRKKITAQSNYIKLYLFVSFFPHIIQGPIAKYDQLAPQLLEKHKFSFENIKTGCMLIIWGVFKKLVIAQRLAPITADIFSNYAKYDGVTILLGSILFSFQIYTDWTAYCDIVTGVAEMMGIKLAKNFDRPYFSQSLPEFWRRWHMSMSAFFKDYVLYPISASTFCLKLNKNSRKVFGNNAGRIISSALPIMAVWFMTGLWHGSNWNYILWGVYQGILIMLSVTFTPSLHKLNEKLNFKTETFGWMLFRIIRTFFLCCVGRLLFNGGSISDSFKMIGRMFRFDFSFSSISNLGLVSREWIVLGVSLLLLLAISVLQNKYEVRKELDKQPILLKWPVIIALIMSIVIFGVYGSDAGYTSFIYEQF